MPLEVTLQGVAAVGLLLVAILGFIYGELRRIDNRLTAIATLTLMNADQAETEVPDNVRDGLFPDND